MLFSRLNQKLSLPGKKKMTKMELENMSILDSVILAHWLSCILDELSPRKTTKIFKLQLPPNFFYYCKDPRK